MSEAIAARIVEAITLYLGLGVLFAGPFVIFGVGRIDPAAREGTWGFRLLILPGTIALWPLVAFRWLRARGVPPRERNAHRDAAAGAARSVTPRPQAPAAHEPRTRPLRGPFEHRGALGRS